MSGDESNNGIGAPSPLPTPPGFTTQPFGPLGVPIPVPDDSGVESPSFEDSDGGAGYEDEVTGTLRGAADVGEDYLSRVEDAIDKETCGFCRNVLEQLRSEPLDRQVTGVRELAELKERMSDSPSEDEIEEIMSGFEVLDEPEQFL